MRRTEKGHRSPKSKVGSSILSSEGQCLAITSRGRYNDERNFKHHILHVSHNWVDRSGTRNLASFYRTYHRSRRRSETLRTRQKIEVAALASISKHTKHTQYHF